MTTRQPELPAQTMTDGNRYVDANVKTTSIQINYSTTDGYSAKYSSNGKLAGSPDEAIRLAAYELARIAEMFGFGDSIEASVKEARQRVRAWFQEEPK